MRQDLGPGGAQAPPSEDVPRHRSLSFQVLARDPTSSARRGKLCTARSEIETPVFMPVGTAGTVKALPQELLESLRVQILLANTYHLYLRPGPEIIARMGGLHAFMSWPRSLLTDSGGFQVFSHRALRRITEEGVEFRSHLDGSLHLLTPERSIQVQEALGADIIMAFDDCTPYPVQHREARESMHRSLRWARRCRSRHRREDQALFGIAQGSVFADLRRESLEEICRMEFPGIALGGFSVGEPRPLMYEILEQLSSWLPADRPRYLMGVGTPLDLVRCVQLGLDMFDCVLPTRNARNGTLFTWQGKIRIKNTRYRGDPLPPDPDCRCLVCRRYSRAYLRHLFVSGEILASVLNTYHNTYYYLDLMAKIRESIALGSLAALEKRLREGYTETA